MDHDRTHHVLVQCHADLRKWTDGVGQHFRTVVVRRVGRLTQFLQDLFARCLARRDLLEIGRLNAVDRLSSSPQLGSHQVFSSGANFTGAGDNSGPDRVAVLSGFRIHRQEFHRRQQSPRSPPATLPPVRLGRTTRTPGASPGTTLRPGYTPGADK